MVKGVNKSVIEISETGSKYFSKVILFVSPEYVAKKSKKLNAEAENIIKKLQISPSLPSLRIAMTNEKKRKRNVIIISSVTVVIFSAMIILLSNFNIL